MAARIAIKALTMLTLTISLLGLFTLIQTYPAHAAAGATIGVTITTPTIVNTDYSITINLNDPGGSDGKHITLSVTSPSSSITSSVTTDSSGHAPAAFHTSTVAGYNNITAIYDGVTYIVPIWLNPGPPYSLNLVASPSYRLANGISTATASARVSDIYNNPISGATITFTVDGTPSTAMTDSTGTASRVIGPYGSTHTANITAEIGGLSRAASVRFLDRNNLVLNRYPATSLPIDSDAEVDAYFYEDLGNSIPAVGVPLSFTAYGPDFAVLGIYSGITDANGKVAFYFHMSQKIGNNTIVVSNNDMGGVLKSTIIYGEGGDVSRIIVTSDPSTPVYADGTSKYILNIWALDSGGNPVPHKQLSIIKNSDTNYTSDSYLTNNNGYMSFSTSASRFVCDDNYTVMSTRFDAANNITITVSSSIILSYRAGPPAAISVRANPNAVANANVTTPTGAMDVHTTDIIATVTDQWNHPLQGQPVAISSLNTTLGNISNGGVLGNTSGTTSDCGEYTVQYTLSSNNHGIDTTVGAPVMVASGSLTGYCNVLYTDNSFLSIKTNITPKTNLSVNDMINVSITVRGIGWKIKGQSYDIALIFDSSGSMDWLSTTIYPDTVNPATGRIEPETGYIPEINTGYSDDPTRVSGGRQLYDLDNRNYHYIDSFTYHGNGSQPIQIMLSSSYYNYSSTGTFYYLKVQAPNGNNYSTSEYYINSGNHINVGGTSYELSGADYDHSSNENYVTINNPVNGATYKIYGAYDYRASKGAAPYNLMVLTSPKRLGLSKVDLDSAAKLAARQFVDNMTDNQVSIVWFNDSSDVAKRLTIVNSNNKTGIYAAINNLNAKDGTSIGLGIASAITELTSSRANKSSKKVAILLSDGYSNQNLQNDYTQAQNAKNKNITIYTIGIGMPDEYILGYIANTTGGNYSKVISADELAHQYGVIASELNKVVANQTDMHIITNSSVINGTLYPDAVYVPNSAWVRYPNGTLIQQEPAIDMNGKYDLRWNPGVIKLNDTWTLNYQLRVLRNGTIEPITNESYINFTREDGTNDSVMFTMEKIYVGGNSSDDLSSFDKLNVTITSPLNASHGLIPYNLTVPSKPITWNVTYNGSYNYKLTLLVDNIAVRTNYIGNEYTIYADTMAPGDHMFEVKATEYITDGNGTVVGTGEEKSDYILLRSLYDSSSSGRITLI
jgi:hypothetical protein